MRSATALRAAVRQTQSRLSIRQPTGARLVRAISHATGAIGGQKDPAKIARDISYAASSEGQHDPDEDTSSRHPPVQHSYFNMRISRPLAATLALVLGGTAAGILFPPDLKVAYHPPQAQRSISSARSISHDASHEREPSAAKLEKSLATLPAVLSLRHDAFERRETDIWRETRHHFTHGPSGTIGHTNMLASALYGPEKIAIPPLVRERVDGREGVVVLHVGNHLCGHDGIVHGGLVATMFDHYLYRFGVQNLDAKIAATAHLAVDYRAPVRANQFLVLKARREEDSRRPHKVCIIGRLEDANGKLLAEAKGIFVAPKNADRFLKPTAASSTS
ncbi:HotDog domain-containing protein [Auriculariales sp. MPI-PUGE-AT-0066]|nr:HotDog domain-containing protein [Auriculariales sp. MPI-PUGE-AT-0066]